MRVKISFAYLMMRHMHDCIRSDRNSALPYSMFLTKVFQAFYVDFENEPYEEKFSYLKGGGAVKKVTKKNPKVARKTVEEDERRFRPSTSRTKQQSGTGVKVLVNVIKELIQEVLNMASCIYTGIEKSKSRAKILGKYLERLKDDHEFSEPEDEEDDEEPLNSQEEEEEDSNAT
ncbi:hypothetical protein PIB30_026548 [Stylosanthes scabra]|uniref:Uncharacterized protein n=1 Tax=Stylosanthes scabra TaxID=79078 RepID=A0ABU6RAQ6_9FABA|nr:hypothetical protein [Stylosanthes scabra]